MNEYIIPIRGLKIGKYEYSFELSKAFFTYFDDNEIVDGRIKVDILVSRNSESTFQFDFSFQGEVIVPCDRCLDNLTQQVTYNGKLFVKYGEEYEEISDEIIVIPDTESSFDVSDVLFQYIKLSIPMVNQHKESECNHDMIEEIRKYQAKIQVDDRMSELKKLLNNN